METRKNILFTILLYFTSVLLLGYINSYRNGVNLSYFNKAFVWGLFSISYIVIYFIYYLPRKKK